MAIALILTLSSMAILCCWGCLALAQDGKDRAAAGMAGMTWAFTLANIAFVVAQP